MKLRESIRPSMSTACFAGDHGRLDADFWFLCMEVGGGESNIGIRLEFQPIMDSAEAYKMLGVTSLHWCGRKIQRTWSGKYYSMLRLEGK